MYSRTRGALGRHHKHNGVHRAFLGPWTSRQQTVSTNQQTGAKPHVVAERPHGHTNTRQAGCSHVAALHMQLSPQVHWSPQGTVANMHCKELKVVSDAVQPVSVSTCGLNDARCSLHIGRHAQHE
jgi:hypothetical protein